MQAANIGDYTAGRDILCRENEFQEADQDSEDRAQG